MPTLPANNKCKELGCKNPKAKHGGVCLDHGGKDNRTFDQKHNQSRKEFNDKYNTAQWRVLRQIQLSKSPLCAGCLNEGIVKSATVVDHLFPWRQISPEAFFINRFQSLCTDHHAEKTWLEQQGIYRRYSKPPVDFGRLDYMTEMAVDDPQDPANR